MNPFLSICETILRDQKGALMLHAPLPAGDYDWSACADSLAAHIVSKFIGHGLPPWCDQQAITV